MAFSFEVTAKDKDTQARNGRMTLTHGEVLTPCFMPVGTQGVVKTLTSKELREAGVSIYLANAYHLYLRPGMEVIREAGGLHKFSGWDGPMLTDSGGFQVFSLAQLAKVSDEGVKFQSHLDGSSHFLTPEKVMDIQQILGSDIIMPLDVCSQYPASQGEVESSLKTTLQWAERSLRSFRRPDDQALFGIVQGGVYKDLREQSAKAMVEMDFPGYALGGLSVGEPAETMLEVIGWTTPHLPKEKPRYLMGLGSPEDLWDAVELGIDMFDCVLPTRNARNGTVFTSEGKMLIKNAEFTHDHAPLDQACRCFTCKNYSRSFLRHLFQSGELLVQRLLTLHNLTYMIDLMGSMRQAIASGTFLEAKKKFRENFFKK